jgi:hypothetical protein
MYGFQISPIFSEASEMKFVSARLTRKTRRRCIRIQCIRHVKGSAIDEQICTDVTPYLSKPKGNDHRATVLDALRNRLYQRAALESFFQANEV